MQAWTPVLAKRGIASELRRLRQAIGITQEAASTQLGIPRPRLSDLEVAVHIPSENDLTSLLELYGATERLPEFLALRKTAKKRGWWFGLFIEPKSFVQYLGYEESAAELNAWNSVYIHDLLQTSEYAMAQIRETMPEASAKDVAEQVDIRMRRQQAWRDRGAARAHLNIVLSESALRLPVSSTTIMREQYEQLLALDQSIVDLRVLLLEAGPHAGVSSPFARLHFDIADDDGVLYLENLISGLYAREKHHLTKADSAFAQLQQKALSKEQTRNFIEQLIAEL